MRRPTGWAGWLEFFVEAGELWSGFRGVGILEPLRRDPRGIFISALDLAFHLLTFLILFTNGSRCYSHSRRWTIWARLPDSQLDCFQ